MAVFNFTQIDNLLQIRDLFPELTEKQFKIAFMWAWGMKPDAVAVANESTLEATKKSLQRSRQALKLGSLESMRNTILLRVVVGMVKECA